MLKATDLQGIFPPVPTPFHQDGEIWPEQLGQNIKQLAQTGLKGFIILGSNGEYVYLDDTEKIKLCEAAREAVSNGQIVVAGTGTESTRATIRLTQAAAQTGVDAAIVITPAYYKPAMTADVLINHFKMVAEASTIPIILYNMPAYTGVDLTVDTVLALAEHPNIIGLKESAGNLVKIAEIVRGVTERGLDFTVLAGSASFLQAALAVGAGGGIVASANVAPQLCVGMYEQREEPTKARILQQSLLPLNAAVTTRYGVAGLKYAMEKRGLYGGPVRSPLLPASDKAKVEIEGILAALFD